MEHPYPAHLPPPHGSTLVLEEARGQRVEIGVGMDRRGCGRLLHLALLGGMPLSAAAAGLLCARPYGSCSGGLAAYGRVSAYCSRCACTGCSSAYSPCSHRRQIEHVWSGRAEQALWLYSELTD